MHLNPSGVQTAGLVVRASVRGKFLSLWEGDTEMAADLTQEQAGVIAAALLAPAGATQILGAVSAFQVPACARGA